MCVDKREVTVHGIHVSNNEKVEDVEKVVIYVLKLVDPSVEKKVK